MYAETGLMFPYFQNFSHEIQSLEEFCYSQKPSASLDSIITTSAISDYDLGCEGDLFKAPELIIEEPMEQLDPIMTAALGMMSCGDDVMQPSGLKISDMQSMQNEQLFCDAFDGCRKELLEKTSLETAVSDIHDVNFPLMMTNEVHIDENKMFPDVPFTKSDSSESLNSVEWASGATVRSNCLDFPEMDFPGSYGMRRAFSEGDIKYACRKALADSQPRVRGRFAKTEDTDNCKKQ
ncbi:hypothetical protein KSS87_015988 [Heliosperma pusillum]|nr:hypothetical protein KSS87_015988 [Heliosperma pusillum]